MEEKEMEEIKHELRWCKYLIYIILFFMGMYFDAIFFD